MARPRASSFLADPIARRVAGRLSYAGAAEFAGEWGSTRLERWLGFTPGVRALAHRAASGIAPASGSCKKWRRGHVPQDQTLRLIRVPEAAAEIRKWRDCSIVQALAADRANPRVVSTAFARIQLSLVHDYWIWVGLQDEYVLRDLLSAIEEHISKSDAIDALSGLLGIVRQLEHELSEAAQKQLDATFREALFRAVSRHPQVAFVEQDLRKYWSLQRARMRKPRDPGGFRIARWEKWLPPRLRLAMAQYASVAATRLSIEE
jgi:hypothetical protein